MPNRTASTLLSLLLVIVAVGCGTADEDKVGLIGDSITDLSREPLTQALGEDRVVEIVGKFGARSDQVIEDVKAKHEALAKATQELGSALYAQAGDAAGGAGPTGASDGAGSAKAASDEDVVDAEIVDDEK